MIGKLIKHDFGYNLLDANGKHIATSKDEYSNRVKQDYWLSLKNCQEIENGYDLDELADEHCNKLYHEGNINWDHYRVHFKLGFKKAIELLGDKKFDEETIFDSVMLGVVFEDIGIKEIETYDELKDLAIKRNTKTEWDVEFEMESNLHIGEVIDESYPKDFPKERPKLNKEGFIILKKI